MATPMHLTYNLSKVDYKLYKGIIGSLLYLTTYMPNILFSVCLCARFQSYP